MNNTMLREFATLTPVTMNALVNKLFENQFGNYDYARSGGSANGASQTNGTPQTAEPTLFRLPIDIQTSDDAFVFTAYLPGVQPDAVEITFEKDELTIKGQFPKKDEANHYVKSELFHGAFERKLSFNTAVDADAIAAHFENGVLSLQVPKTPEAKPKKIAVVAK